MERLFISVPSSLPLCSLPPNSTDKFTFLHRHGQSVLPATRRGAASSWTSLFLVLMCCGIRNVIPTLVRKDCNHQPHIIILFLLQHAIRWRVRLLIAVAPLAADHGLQGAQASSDCSQAPDQSGVVHGLSCPVAYGILVPGTGIKRVSPAFKQCNVIQL